MLQTINGNQNVVEDNYHHTTTTTSTILIILFVIPATLIVIVTIAGNLLVLCFKARVGKRSTTLLIWNLGLADFLVGIFVLPMGIANVIQQRWTFGRLLCRVWISCDIIFCTASILTLCAISIDRYIGVTRPLSYKQLVTKKRIIAFIVLIWTFSISILLGTIKYDTYDIDIAINITSNYTPSESSSANQVCNVAQEVEYVVHSVITAFLLPAAITLILYWKIYAVARNRENGLQQGLAIAIQGNFFNNSVEQRLRVHHGRSNNNLMAKQRRVLRMHKQVAKTLGIMVSTFLLCWLPFFVTYLIDHACHCIPFVVLDVLTWLGYCNSMLNPIIYAFTVNEFKQTIKHIICCQWRMAFITVQVANGSIHRNIKELRKSKRAYSGAQLNATYVESPSMQSGVQFTSHHRQLVRRSTIAHVHSDQHDCDKENSDFSEPLRKISTNSLRTTSSNTKLLGNIITGDKRISSLRSLHKNDIRNSTDSMHHSTVNSTETIIVRTVLERVPEVSCDNQSFNFDKIEVISNADI